MSVPEVSVAALFGEDHSWFIWCDLLMKSGRVACRDQTLRSRPSESFDCVVSEAVSKQRRGTTDSQSSDRAESPVGKGLPDRCAWNVPHSRPHAIGGRSPEVCVLLSPYGLDLLTRRGAPGAASVSVPAWRGARDDRRPFHFRQLRF